MKQLVAIIFLSVCLTSCSWFRHENDYQNSKMIRPTTVPKGLSSSKIHNYYPQPAQAPKTITKPDLLPPGAKK